MKILALVPNSADGTSWYRATLPLARMQKKYDDIQYIEYHLKDVAWSDMVHFDILFMQRPYTPAHVTVMMKALWHGLKVWMDFDDLLWGIPLHNPAFSVYNIPENKEAMQLLFNNAHRENVVISVSTNQLLRECLKVNQNANVVLIPNAIDDRMMPSREAFRDRKEEKPLVAWRGSDTHMRDLYDYRGAIEYITANYNTEFIGMRPFFVDNYQHSRHKLEDYFYYLSKRKWDLFFVCLQDNAFNRCKSNIVWLEAFMAGSITVVPDWEEWKVPGVIIYDTGGNYQQALTVKVDVATGMSYARRKNVWLSAYDYVETHLLLSVTNQTRYEMLQNLLYPPPPIPVQEEFIDTE